MTGFTQLTSTYRGLVPLLGLIIVQMMILSACSRTLESQSGPAHVGLPPESAVLTTATHSTPDAIVQLLIEERRAIQARDMEWLETVWTDDARIIDGRGTTDPVDDYLWQGKPAILDRYLVAVFTNPPPLISADDVPMARLEINHDETIATLQSDIDSWIFRRQNQGWRIYQLTYNQP